MWVEGANLAWANAVVIAIDTSGSIRETGRLPLEKTMAIGVINVLLMQNFMDPIVAVYAFNSDIETPYVVPPTRLSNLSLNQVISAINGIQDTPNLTWLNGAILEACNVTQPVRPNGTLILLTDGLPTTPDRNGSRNISAAMTATLNAAQNYKNNCSTLSDIGRDLDEEAREFLQTIASPGAFLPVSSWHVAEDFETCDFSKLPWETGGDADWFVTSDEAHSGHCSARAGRIDDVERTYLELTTEVTGESISFWYKVSSESGYDYLCFYIDGYEVDCWSGEIDWSYTTYPVHPGTHTFTWEYMKDGSMSYGYDTAWIDDISFGAGGMICSEPNDDPTSACQITLPFSGQFEISPEEDVDFFTFPASAGTMVIIDVDADEIGSALDAYLCLYDEYGNMIDCDDDTHGFDPYIEAFLHNTGTYYIEVGGYGGYSEGVYVLKVEATAHH